MSQASPPFETPSITPEDDPRITTTDEACLPCADIRMDGDCATFELTGIWDVGSCARARSLMQQTPPPPGCRSVTLSLAGAQRIDTAGALIVTSAAQEMRSAELAVDITGSEAQLALVQRVSSIDMRLAPKVERIPPVIRTLNAIGASIVEEARLVRNILGFTGMFIITLVGLVVRPWRFRWVSLCSHMEQTGIYAVPIVALLSFLIGLVTTYMGAAQFAKFGAQVFVINMLEISTLREMGVLLTALVVAGRSGSSFTAQIGSMMANEEVAAMRSMGLDPMEVLVVPRVLALVIMLPVLAFIADIMGILGGGVAAWGTLDIEPAAFTARFREIVQLRNFIVGIVKAPFFAFSIALIGCFQGFRVTGSAESVGRLTTQSVVESIFMVIVLNAIFAILFTTLGV